MTSYGALAPMDSVSAPANDASSLLARLARGEPSAVAEVYDEHQAAIHGFARRLVGDAAAAQDLVHEVFLTLPKVIGGFRRDASLRTFLLSIAVNHARHHLRAAARRRFLAERFAREPAAHPGTPEQALLQRSLAKELSRAMDTLPVDQRIAFVLCEVEERTSREVADIVGVPEGTVRTRLFHAKRKLREELEKRGLR